MIKCQIMTRKIPDWFDVEGAIEGPLYRESSPDKQWFRNEIALKIKRFQILLNDDPFLQWKKNITIS